MSDFIKYVNKFSELSKEAEEDLLPRLKSRSFKKGQIINKEGQICKNLFFIDKGLVKHYYHHKDRVFILRFFSETNFFTVLDSFVNQTPSRFITIALEDTETTTIDYADFDELCRKHHSFETFSRKLFTMAALVNLKRIKEMFDEDATELYKEFMNENHHLLQRISLGDTASYIGISQVTLSRIRARK
jgi:signal-transduction protein with cAMP-binding, CBS, and nucleotidyltransferase domain